MTVAQGREAYFTQELQPLIERAFAGQKTEKGFKTAVMKDLGARSDTAFNLRSSVGKTSYMHTESFKNSRLDEVGLQAYMQKLHTTSGMNKNSPVYARAITPEPLQFEVF